MSEPNSISIKMADSKMADNDQAIRDEFTHFIKLQNQLIRSASRLTTLFNGEAPSISKPADKMDVEGSSNDESAHKEPEKINPAISLPFDEPLILHHGGKLARAYLDEALPHDQDYSTTALYKNCFTNSMFQRCFDTIHWDFGLSPRWITQHVMTKELCQYPYAEERRDIHQFMPYNFSRTFPMVRKFSRGLCLLMAIEASPSKIGEGGVNRTREALQALDQHPTIKYVLKGMLEFARINVEVHHTTHLFKNPTTGWAATPIDPALQRKRKDFIDELRKAVFEGDLAWFKNRYDKQGTDTDSDDTDSLESPCERCGGWHEQDDESSDFSL